MFENHAISERERVNGLCTCLFKNTLVYRLAIFRVSTWMGCNGDIDMPGRDNEKGFLPLDVPLMKPNSKVSGYTIIVDMK